MLLAQIMFKDQDAVSGLLSISLRIIGITRVVYPGRKKMDGISIFRVKSLVRTTTGITDDAVHFNPTRPNFLQHRVDHIPIMRFD